MTAKKILIIEDNPENMKLMADVLTAQGFDVLKANEGLAGIEILKQNSKETGLVLLDLKLPDISGLEVLKTIKSAEATREIPVIVVSAHAMEADITATKQAGCTDYFTKPINIVEFLTKVRTYV
ncbi:MAG: response regulator [Candidatus Gastranaerophilales bacterium]|jgi:two-component system cell cycle response regulator DivK|nr:response regulator [Candidatus Gastranaerophilales bacterium]